MDVKKIVIHNKSAELNVDAVMKHIHVSDEERRNFNEMPDNGQRIEFVMNLFNRENTLIKEFKAALKSTHQGHLDPFTKRDVKRAAERIYVNGCKCVKLMRQHDKSIIHLREYIKYKGKFHPTKKCILLTPED